MSSITSWNLGAERIFGYTADEIIGSSIMRLIPDDRHEKETEILSRIRRGERVDVRGYPPHGAGSHLRPG